jgi:hypothetical protein
MSDRNILTLRSASLNSVEASPQQRQADQVLGRSPNSTERSSVARTDFALPESHLETIAGRIARVPTRAFLCRMLLLATASIWALLAVVLLKMR